MVVDIIPATRLTKNLSYFSYLAPSQLEGKIKIGQLVEIPFRGKVIQGIVIKVQSSKLKAQNNYKLKEIIKIVSEEPILSKEQLKIVGWMASYYYVSPAVIVKMIIPRIPKRRIKSIPPALKEKSAYIFKEVEMPVLDQIRDVVTRFISLSKKGKSIFLLHFKDAQARFVTYSKIIAYITNVVGRDKQVIILVPQINDVFPLFSFLEENFKGQIAILHGNLSKTTYYNEWQKVQRKEAKIIIGPRSAIFAPVKDLGLIIIDKEENENFKQRDQSPRYHARKIAIKLRELTGAKIILSGLAPSVESYYWAKKGEYEYLPLLNSSSALLHPSLVNMRDEIKKGNYSPISQKLQEEIATLTDDRPQGEKIIKQKKKIVLFLNRRGTSTITLCADCNWLFRCPYCDIPLVLHEFFQGLDRKKTVGKLMCHHCKWSQDIPLTCPRCHGHKIKFFGTGTQKIEETLKKQFPKAKIKKVDKDSDIKIKDFSKFDICIGTTLLLQNIDSIKNEIALIGIISADTLFYLADFYSTEKTFGLLSEISDIALETAASKFIIQTHTPQNYVIQAILKASYPFFYHREIEERKNFNYPPFAKLIKLIYRHRREKKCLYEVRNLHRKLKTKKFKGIEISDPLPAHTRKIRGRYQWYIIIKGQETRDKRQEEMLMKLVPNDWIIDVDPISLL
ncbi:MAG: primosomal protein N' [Parcubacteria group bacterium CG23_combo_of_CG06-09_8_20_14_all_35_9]|nr:MAG: primosomal protein N' [Parcubacteria group bacterium CG23_combo_of_CG06-09_8_20_14_all_35_9]